MDEKPKSRVGSLEVEAEMATSMPMSRRNKKIKNEENKGNEKKIESPDGVAAAEVASKKRGTNDSEMDWQPKALKYAPDPRYVLTEEEFFQKEEDKNMLRILKEWGYELSDASTMEQELYFCLNTKDGHFCCSDHTVVPFHKSVAANKSSVLKTTFYRDERVCGSSEIYHPISALKVNANYEATLFVVQYLYFGLTPSPMKWRVQKISEWKGNHEEKTAKWAKYVCEIATVALEFNLGGLYKFLLCDAYEVIFSNIFMAGDFLSELMHQDSIEDFRTLACHSYWFLNSVTSNHGVFSYGTDLSSPSNNEVLDRLDEKLFGEKPDIDFKTTPTVLMLGSNIDDMNGIYKMINPQEKMECDFQYEKSMNGSSSYLFSEKWHGRPGKSTELGCCFRLEKQQTAVPGTLVGKWTRLCGWPEWKTLDDMEAPVPLRFCMTPVGKSDGCCCGYCWTLIVGQSGLCSNCGY